VGQRPGGRRCDLRQDERVRAQRRDGAVHGRAVERHDRGADEGRRQGGDADRRGGRGVALRLDQRDRRAGRLTQGPGLLGEGRDPPETADE
jgi:hypothetical protein